MTKEQYDRVAQEDKDHSEELQRRLEEADLMGGTKPLQKQTVDLPASFTRACKAAGVEATQRQYRKFLKKQGQAYRNP